MKTSQLIAVIALFVANLLPQTLAVCHVDDLKKGLNDITKLHRQSVEILMGILENSPHGTSTHLDLDSVLNTHSMYQTQKHNYVVAVKKLYEICWKLDRSFGKDGEWRNLFKTAVQIRNKTNILNQSCFNEQDISVDTSGGEDELIEKVLQAVLEMFIAEIFLNEHFNHLLEPYSKI